MRILVVDDDIVDRESVKRSVNDFNFQCEIVEAQSVDNALILCQQQKFDVILLDYRMPEKDGVELVIELSESSDIRKNVIVMMSNSENDSLALDCIEAGAQDFLLKSEITASRLKRAILHAQKRFELENQLKESYLQAKHLSEKDSLTQLANRYLFEESFKIAVANNQRASSQLILLVFDVDNFKLINDNYGHGTGDKLLVKVSKRIQSCLRGNELFARLGGDEFAIALTHQSSVEIGASVALRMHRVLKAPFEINGYEILVSISVGIAFTKGNEHTPEELLKQADIAMYRSKRKAPGMTTFFEDEMQARIEYRLFIESGLNTALKNSQFVLYFQPILETQSKELYGFEALIRWRTERGMISPDEFIKVAEESHKMIEIGRWVIQEATRQLGLWNKSLNRTLHLSINLSPNQLADDSLIDTIALCCDDAGISPAQLEFELTETALIHKPENVKSALYRLKSLGSQIALDDFGTGYSSISHLQHFPIDTVKLDRSLMPNDSYKNTILINALADMLHAIGMQTVAEGIENLEHQQLCEKLKIYRIQGYFISRPLPIDQIKITQNSFGISDQLDRVPNN